MSKAIRACIALAAFAAFAVLPATASAVNDPQVRDDGTKLIEVTHKKPVNIIATGEGDLVMTGGGGETLVECDTATLTGKLETNEGTGINTVVEGTITTAEFRNHATTECTGESGPELVTPNHTSNPSTNGLPWCVRSTGTMNTDEFQVRGGGCTDPERPIRFILHTTSIFGTITCAYERNAPIVGTYKTHPEAATMSISKQAFPLKEGGFLCPDEGFLDQAFTLALDENEKTGTALAFTNQE